MDKMSVGAQKDSAYIAGAAAALTGKFKRVLSQLGLTIGDAFIKQLHQIIMYDAPENAKALRRAFGPWYGWTYRMNESVARREWTEDDGSSESSAVQNARASVTNKVPFSMQVMLLFSHNPKECANLTDPDLRKTSDGETPSKQRESFSNRFNRIEAANFAYIREQGLTSNLGKTLDRIEAETRAHNKALKLLRVERAEVVKAAMTAEFNPDMSEFTVDLKIGKTLPKVVVTFLRDVKRTITA